MIAETDRLYWVDENLPPALAEWLASKPNTRSSHLRELGLSTALDRAIFDEAHDAAAVVVSKDEDFANLVTDRGPPPQVVWVRTGNARTADLIALFEKHFDALGHLLDDGQPLVVLES